MSSLNIPASRLYIAHFPRSSVRLPASGLNGRTTRLEQIQFWGKLWERACRRWKKKKKRKVVCLLRNFICPVALVGYNKRRNGARKNAIQTERDIRRDRLEDGKRKIQRPCQYWFIKRERECSGTSTLPRESPKRRLNIVQQTRDKWSSISRVIVFLEKFSRTILGLSAARIRRSIMLILRDTTPLPVRVMLCARCKIIRTIIYRGNVSLGKKQQVTGARTIKKERRRKVEARVSPQDTTLMSTLSLFLGLCSGGLSRPLETWTHTRAHAHTHTHRLGHISTGDGRNRRAPCCNFRYVRPKLAGWKTRKKRVYRGNKFRIVSLSVTLIAPLFLRWLCPLCYLSTRSHCRDEAPRTVRWNFIKVSRAKQIQIDKFITWRTCGSNHRWTRFIVSETDLYEYIIRIESRRVKVIGKWKFFKTQAKCLFEEFRNHTRFSGQQLPFENH